MVRSLMDESQSHDREGRSMECGIGSWVRCAALVFLSNPWLEPCHSFVQRIVVR